MAMGAMELMVISSLMLLIILVVMLIVLAVVPKSKPKKNVRKRVVNDLDKIKEQVNGDHE